MTDSTKFDETWEALLGDDANSDPEGIKPPQLGMASAEPPLPPPPSFDETGPEDKPITLRTSPTLGGEDSDAFWLPPRSMFDPRAESEERDAEPEREVAPEGKTKAASSRVVPAAVDDTRRRMPWMVGAGLAVVGFVAWGFASGTDETATHPPSSEPARIVVPNDALAAEAAPAPVPQPVAEPEPPPEPEPVMEPEPEPEPEPVAEPEPEAPATPKPKVDPSIEAAEQAYAQAERDYQASPSNEALERMVASACQMDDGVKARSAFRKLRGGEQRARLMVSCRKRQIDVRAKGDGPTAPELVRKAKQALESGDAAAAVELARTSNNMERTQEAILLLGRAHCELEQVEDARALLRHLPVEAQPELETLCRERGVEL